MTYVIHMSSTCHLKVDTSSTHCLWYCLYILSSTTQFPHILYTNAHCQCHVDVVRTCTHDTQIWLVDNIHHLYVIRMSSAGWYIIHTSSAALLMVTIVLNYLSTMTGIGYWIEFVTKCWVVSFQDHINDLRDNLCWWFCLHIASRHCSHVICIFTCHLHIIWAYAYNTHIICTGPWYVSFQQTMPMLPIHYLEYSLHILSCIIHFLHIVYTKHILSMLFRCCPHMYISYRDLVSWWHKSSTCHPHVIWR